MKRIISSVLAIAMVAVMLTSCGTSVPSTVDPAAPSDAGKPPSSLVSDETIYGLPKSETFVFGAVSDCATLEPQRINKRLDASIVHYHIHDVLAWRDTDGTITPRLAKEWKQIDDLTWEFVLRDNVYAHDGEKLTSEDVKFSMERAKIEEFNQNYQLPFQTALKEVKIIDDLTFQLITETPALTMEFWLFEAPILPRKYYSENSLDAVAEKPIGFGPYKFVEWVKNDHLTVSAYDKYWGGTPSIKNIIFRVIPEESARLNELRAGSIDFAEQISIDIGDQADTEISRLDIQEGLRKMLLSIPIEKGNPALKDVRVRQALNYAIDKQSIIDNILSGYTKVYSSYVNPKNNNPELEPYPYNPEKAKQLLAEAGYAQGLTLTIQSPSARYGLDKEITMQMSEDLKAVGIDCKTEYMELGIYLDKLDAKELTGLAWVGWAALVNPIVENLILTSGHVDNSATYSNIEFDKLYQQMLSTMDADKRQDLNFAMQEIVWEECPWVFLWKLPQLNGVSKRVDWKIRNDGYYDVFNAKMTN